MQPFIAIKIVSPLWGLKLDNASRRHFGTGAEVSGQFGPKTLRHQDISALVSGHFGTNKVALPLSVIPHVLSLLIWPSGRLLVVKHGPRHFGTWDGTVRHLGQDSSALRSELSLGHFGTSADLSGQFGPTRLVPKCPGSEVSWVRSVRNSF